MAGGYPRTAFLSRSEAADGLWAAVMARAPGRSALWGQLPPTMDRETRASLCMGRERPRAQERVRGGAYRITEGRSTCLPGFSAPNYLSLG